MFDVLKEGDAIIVDDLTRIASAINNYLDDEDFKNENVESAEMITDLIGKLALRGCRIHNKNCIKMNRYDCFTLFC